MWHSHASNAPRHIHLKHLVFRGEARNVAGLRRYDPPEFPALLSQPRNLRVRGLNLMRERESARAREREI